MSWLASGDDQRAVVGQLPGIAKPYFALELSLWNQPHLPAQVLELCRLRLAQLHRCTAEFERREQVLAQEKRAALSRWECSEHFTAAERACLAFTEVYAMDAQALTDQHAATVKQHFGDAGLVMLVEALGVLDGMTRLTLLWQLGPASGHEKVRQ
jgi:alkylhydroperoxidase family enzyme